MRRRARRRGAAWRKRLGVGRAVGLSLVICGVVVLLGLEGLHAPKDEQVLRAPVWDSSIWRPGLENDGVAASFASNGRPEIDRHRQHQPAGVVGVITDEIDPTRCKDAHRSLSTTKT